MTSLCNPLHPQFLSNLSETLHSYFRYIEGVYPAIDKEKKSFLRNYGLFKLRLFLFYGKYRMTSMYNQLLPQFLSNQSETLHNCCIHIENVHLLF